MNKISDCENITFEFNETDVSPSIDANDYVVDNNLTAEFYQLMNGSVNTDPIVGGEEYDTVFLDIKNYDLNYTVKQLMQICEYYNLSKDIKTNKLKKQDIIEQIIMFENNYDNYDIVLKRKEMWYYMNELKNDKNMKKIVIFI